MVTALQTTAVFYTNPLENHSLHSTTFEADIIVRIINQCECAKHVQCFIAYIYHKLFAITVHSTNQRYRGNDAISISVKKNIGCTLINRLNGCVYVLRLRDDCLASVLGMLQ